MSRQDPGNRYSSRLNPPAGDRQLEWESAQAADSPITLPCGIQTPRRQYPGQSLRLIGTGRGTTQVVPDRSNGMPDIFCRGAGPNFHIHVSRLCERTPTRTNKAHSTGRDVTDGRTSVLGQKAGAAEQSAISSMPIPALIVPEVMVGSRRT